MESPSDHIYTPSELNREVRLHLEAGFPRLLVEAEISNLARPASGHLYFSLKDEKAQIRCALFRSAANRLGFRPENGMKVLARGRIGLYEARGEFQMVVDGMREAGEGLLQRQFEELKKKLEKEGLFDQQRKRALPGYPVRIAAITSPSGAAIRDVLHVLERRWPMAAVRVYPVRVQGTEAPAEIVAALGAANRHGWAELLIVGRGGGSLEDLMAFNDEAVARAVAASTVPVVSAVGHETDFSICDFAADLRAPTPSAAAELSTPDQSALKQAFDRLQRQLERRITDSMQRDAQKVDHLAHRLAQKHPSAWLTEQDRRLQACRRSLAKAMNRRMAQETARLTSLEHRLAGHHPGRRLDEFRARLSRAGESLKRQAGQALETRRGRVCDLARTLNAVSPLQTLARGYAVVLTEEGGRLVGRVGETAGGEKISAQLTDGRLHCTVDRIDEKILGEEED
jgi:exodeoxyribonuclease VII large subunit